MKNRFLLGSYQAAQSPYHHLPIAVKGVLFIAYCSFVLIVQDSLPLAATLLIFAVGAKSARLPVSRWTVLVPALVIVGQLAIQYEPQLNSIMSILTLIIKVTLLNHLLHWYGQLTPPQASLAWFQKRFRQKWLQGFFFMLSISLSTYPNIRRDLEKAINVEMIRRGSRPKWWMGFTWYKIFLNTLVRLINRSSSLGQSVIERGYQIGEPFTSFSDATSEIKFNTLLKCFLPALAGFLIKLSYSGFTSSFY
jgi:energy-coupling factor transporter transmembrane protein EcfT